MTSSLALKATSVSDLPFSELMRLAIKSLALRNGVEPDKNFWLREHPDTLHRTLLELKTRLQSNLPPLEEIHFITSGPFPYSSEVSQALDRLQQANAISRENPSYQRFSPKVFKDTKDLVPQEIETLFGSNKQTRAAFDAFVKGLEAIIDPGT